MKPRCKAGDMAVMTRRGRNVGRFFDVVEAVGHRNAGDTFEFRGRRYATKETGFVWFVRPLGGPAINLNGRFTKDGIAHDHDLQPIRPPGSDVKTSASEPKREKEPA